jgi:hypothetical protein
VQHTQRSFNGTCETFYSTTAGQQPDSLYISATAMVDRLLRQLSAELLDQAAHELPEARPNGPALRSLVLRLPDGQRARITFVRMQSKRGDAARWRWIPEHAEIMPEE